MGTHTGAHPTRAQSPDETFESLREKSYKSVQHGLTPVPMMCRPYRGWGIAYYVMYFNAHRGGLKIIRLIGKRDTSPQRDVAKPRRGETDTAQGNTLG